MTITELLISVSILLALAILRFGLPLSITWLVARVLKSTLPSTS